MIADLKDFNKIISLKVFDAARLNTKALFEITKKIENKPTYNEVQIIKEHLDSLYKHLKEVENSDNEKEFVERTNRGEKIDNPTKASQKVENLIQNIFQQKQIDYKKIENLHRVCAYLLSHYFLNDIYY